MKASELIKALEDGQMVVYQSTDVCGNWVDDLIRDVPHLIDDWSAAILSEQALKKFKIIKPKKKVKLYAYLTDYVDYEKLKLCTNDRLANGNSSYTRVPSEDKEIEVEYDKEED